MNEYISIWEDLPQRQLGMEQCSVNVCVRLEDGREVIAYYAEDNAEWYEYDTPRKIPHGQVISWKSI